MALEGHLLGKDERIVFLVTHEVAILFKASPISHTVMKNHTVGCVCVCVCMCAHAYKEICTEACTVVSQTGKYSECLVMTQSVSFSLLLSIAHHNFGGGGGVGWGQG